MKNLNSSALFILLCMSCMLSSCEAIAGIFKAGMGVGAFAVIAVLVLIIFLIVRMMGGRGK